MKVRLSKEEIVFLKNHTKYAEDEIKILFDDFIKKFPSGKITEDDFVDFYENVFPFNDGFEIRDHVFQAYDKERNGHMKAKDFILWIGGIVLGQTQILGGRQAEILRPNNLAT